MNHKIPLFVALSALLTLGCSSSDDSNTPAGSGTPNQGGQGSPTIDDPQMPADDGTSTDPAKDDPTDPVDTPTPCEGPSDPGTAALCVSFDPEAMQLEEDVQLDGNGVLFVEVFDTPTPDQEGADPIAPIAEQIFPAQDGSDGATEVSITELPTVRFDGLPDTVYVRTRFIDNPVVIATDSLLWGTWLGGIDLSNGLLSPGLEAVSLAAGEAHDHAQPLTAIRHLQIQVGLADGVRPLDDAQGPLTFASWSGAEPAAGGFLTGMGVEACVDLLSGFPTVIGALVLGPGPHYLVAKLDDYNLGGDPTPGSIVSAPITDGTLQIPQGAAVELAADQYALALALDLEHIEPVGSSAPAPFACPVQ